MKGKFIVALTVVSLLVFLSTLFVFKRVADSIIGVQPVDTLECQKAYTKAKQCIDAEFDR